MAEVNNGAFQNQNDIISADFGKNCKTIGDNAFIGCSNLESVVIGNSVTSIGDDAFRDCSDLIEVHIHDIEAWCRIDFADYDANPLYYGGNLYLNDELVTELVIPEGVKEIKNYAFSGCSCLTSVKIPNSVTKIGEMSFYKCSNLYEVEIGEDVEEIEERAFVGCINIKNIVINNNNFYESPIDYNVIIDKKDTNNKTLIFGNKYTTAIPNDIKIIGDNAFESCGSLKSIEIPNSVTSIGSNAFYNCKGLTSITIPNNVTEIKYRAFYGCSSLTSVTIGNSVKSIGKDAFKNCTNLSIYNYSNIHIDDNIASNVANIYTIVDNYRFAKINGENVLIEYSGDESEPNLPNSFFDEEYIIGEKTFFKDNNNVSEITKITKITIPNKVKSIENNAFNGLSSLNEIVINNGTTRLTLGYNKTKNKGLFYDCLLEKIYLGRRLNYSGDYKCGYSPFYKDETYKEILTSVTISNTVYRIGKYLFYGCKGLTSIEIPNSVTSIGDYAFYSCDGLTSIEIPNSVTSIGEGAFYECKGLTSIEFLKNDETLLTIRDWAFGYCEGLTSITIPNGVTEIGQNAFIECTNLTSVKIPNNVTSIGGSAFNGCKSLTSIEIPNSVTSIGYEAFLECSGLKSVVIGNSVTSIGEYAFSSCSDLTSIEIPNSVTSIGVCAFRHCSGLTSIVIGNSVTSIGDEAFKGCENLKTIYNFSPLNFERGTEGYGCIALYIDDDKNIHNNPNGLKVGDYLFRKFDGASDYTLIKYIGNDKVLELPQLPNNDKYVIVANDNDADIFKGNTIITSITIPECVTSIGSSAFEGCTGLTSITIPNSVKSIGDDAFYGCTGLKEVHISDIAAWCSIGFSSAYANPLYYAKNLYLNGELATEITIPNSVTTIGNRAFQGCISLINVTIGEGVTVIGQYAFNDCSGLTSIIIPNSVTSIDELSFYYCTSLINVTIGEGVTSIGRYAFDGCTNISAIYIRATVPPTLGTNSFIKNKAIYVPKDSLSDYKEKWNAYANYIFSYDYEQS